MQCDDLDSLIEAIADGSISPEPAVRAHLDSCASCSARLERARAIEQWLALRETPLPPPSFTAAVMGRIGQEKWKTERAIDIGFNLAVAAGLLFIAAGAAGLAWSFGLFTVTIDLTALLEMAASQYEGQVMSELQTMAIAIALLTTALVLWWWAEAATD